MAGKFFWNNIAVEAVAKKALQDAAERAMKEVGQSSAQLAARKSGAMRGSARIDVEEDRVTLTYGGPSADYALFQHEHAPYKKPTTPYTEPKYVEKPFKTMIEENPLFLPEVINYVKSVLRSRP